jgi:HK97 family phage prohead protease
VTTKENENARMKAGEDDHTVMFYALRFDSAPDKQGDIIAKGSLDGWLPRFLAAGRPLPVSYSHSSVFDTRDPKRIVGFVPAKADHIGVDDSGLWAKAVLFNDAEAQAVFERIKAGVIGGASAFFLVAKGGERKNPDGSTTITEIQEVRELGPTSNPINENSRVLAFKSDVAVVETEIETPVEVVDEEEATEEEAVTEGETPEPEVEVREEDSEATEEDKQRMDELRLRLLKIKRKQ